MKRTTTIGQRGFTLIELAIVLLILGALFAGILIPFTTQVELRRVGETQKTLLEIREALIGFAAAKGRLPVPLPRAATGRKALPLVAIPSMGIVPIFLMDSFPARYSASARLMVRDLYSMRGITEFVTR